MQSMKSIHSIAETMGGLVVTGVLPGSPSERAGVRYGDILLRYNGMPTPDFRAYVEAKSQEADGFRVTIFRDGRELDLTLEAVDSSAPSPIRLAAALDHLANARLFGRAS